MCGIFGRISAISNENSDIRKIVHYSSQRGMDSSGLLYRSDENSYCIERADYKIGKLLKRSKPFNSSFLIGHSRLITNGLSDNQPVTREKIAVIHNGIIVNEEEVWKSLPLKRNFKIDSEAIVGVAEDYLSRNECLSGIGEEVLRKCKGIVACALLIADQGKLVLFSNNGSLYLGDNSNGKYFASERYPLEKIDCRNIKQVKKQVTFDVPVETNEFEFREDKKDRVNLIPTLKLNNSEEQLLVYEPHKLKRCRRCVLPETMPFIHFDKNGVCNYCTSYKKRNKLRPKEELFELVEKYRRKGEELDCIVPFSGGRDSCYGLHLIVEELKMKPVTYTYDWGMVTDLGRRNISRMCSQMGVENIIVAADISKKRKNIAMNLKAWLKSPNLGMISLLTAGDKHFFRYVEKIKQQTGINLNLWGVNPLEVTHFKSGFLGVKPDFEEKMVYANGVRKQVNYHLKRFKAMAESPGYFNSSLWDTLSGEYYRSFTKKEDYFHIFDYWHWNENNRGHFTRNL